MRWLVTGVGGLLGQDVTRALAAEDVQVVGLNREELDITVPSTVRAAFARHRPDIVVNCAAYTAVDGAESHAALAFRVNGDGPRYLARACAEHHTRLLHVSTDYVFSGETDSPYSEDHPTTPCNVYGLSKQAGEQAVLGLLPELGTVVRTAWLYGAHGRSFVRTMADRAIQRDTVEVVADQIGQPTWSADVAARLVALGRTPEARGVFHATNAGQASWFELAREVFWIVNADPEQVRPTTSQAYRTVAPRPRFTVLGHERWQEVGAAPPRDWRSALVEALTASH